MTHGGRHDPTKRTSKYRGVGFQKNRKTKPWRVVVSFEGQKYYLWFDTELEAARGYDALTRRLRGVVPRHRLNFPR